VDDEGLFALHVVATAAPDDYGGDSSCASDGDEGSEGEGLLEAGLLSEVFEMQRSLEALESELLQLEVA
jgi:hypothetical protein